MKTRHEKWGGVVSKYFQEPRDAVVRRVCRDTGHGVTKFASRLMIVGPITMIVE
jgi:hypothetical protein